MLYCSKLAQVNTLDETENKQIILRSHVNHSKYFYNLLENQKTPYDTVEIPQMGNVLGDIIDGDQMERNYGVPSLWPKNWKKLILSSARTNRV